MTIHAPEHFSDNGYRQAMREELERGVDPSDLDEMGQEVYGVTPHDGSVPTATFETSTGGTVAQTVLPEMPSRERPLPKDRKLTRDEIEALRRDTPTDQQQAIVDQARAVKANMPSNPFAQN